MWRSLAWSSLTLTLMLVAGCKREPASGLPPPSATSPNAPAVATAPTPAPPPADDPHAAAPTPAGDPAPATPPADPHGGMTATQGPPRTPDKLADGRLALGPFAVAVPAGWTVKPVTSSMRAADFAVGSDAELIVYYFGTDGAGSVDDNLTRWIGQFTQPDGKPSQQAAKIEKLTYADQAATIVSVSGHYAAMAMPGAGDAVDKDNQALLGAIIGSPTGPYYFKLVGAKATVDANAAKFRTMFSTLKLK